MGSLRPWHIAVLVVVLILLFGAKRLPDAARSLGKSMRILKTEVKGMSDDDVESKAEAQHGREPLDSRPQLDRQPDGTPARGPAHEQTHDPIQRVRDN
jgi:sec-independent protein translocase protein TatA